jgi:hypothetical protein
MIYFFLERIKACSDEMKNISNLLSVLVISLLFYLGCYNFYFLACLGTRGE